MGGITEIVFSRVCVGKNVGTFPGKCGLPVMFCDVSERV